jgi:hypothetical protein
LTCNLPGQRGLARRSLRSRISPGLDPASRTEGERGGGRLGPAPCRGMAGSAQGKPAQGQPHVMERWPQFWQNEPKCGPAQRRASLLPTGIRICHYRRVGFCRGNAHQSTASRSREGKGRQYARRHGLANCVLRELSLSPPGAGRAFARGLAPGASSSEVPPCDPSHRLSETAACGGSPSRRNSSCERRQRITAVWRAPIWSLVVVWLPSLRTRAARVQRWGDQAKGAGRFGQTKPKGQGR